MGEMKSAWEKAMEKAERLGKPTDEELKQLEYVPAGNALAARYLQEDNVNLDAELTKYKGTGIRQYIVKGIQETLLRNITLPHNDHDKQVTTKAIKGIKIFKENKKQLDVLYDRINNLLSYYEQARVQAFNQFKSNFEAKIQDISKTLQQRTGTTANLEAQIQLQFQEEWRRASSELDRQYEKTLEEHKQEIVKLT
jgi:hypothetical protein